MIEIHHPTAGKKSFSTFFYVMIINAISKYSYLFTSSNYDYCNIEIHSNTKF